MTPDDFAAILAARTPRRHENLDIDSATARLAPLLLDLWRAADAHQTMPGDPRYCGECGRLWPCRTGDALAALEAAT